MQALERRLLEGAIKIISAKVSEPFFVFFLFLLFTNSWSVVLATKFFLHASYGLWLWSLLTQLLSIEPKAILQLNLLLLLEHHCYLISFRNEVKVIFKILLVLLVFIIRVVFTDFVKRVITFHIHKNAPSSPSRRFLWKFRSFEKYVIKALLSAWSVSWIH